jgi:23S rRNA pseudouridine1911/1915/1917 synthase
MARVEGTIQTKEPVRFDRYMAEELRMLTRSQLKARIVLLLVNGKDCKLSRMVDEGDRFVVELLDEPDRSSATRPEDIPLSVLYEDDSAIVVDKPQGMVVHPAHGNWSGTLANALLGRCAAGSDGASADSCTPPRAGIVHRLDKDTSGVIIAGKTAAAQEFLAAQFRGRTTVKTYVAIVRRAPKTTSGRLDGWLARDPRERKRFAPSAEGTGKRAITEWRIIAQAGGYTVLALGLRTGRTHQLRVHCKALGCPILGDPIYGEADKRFPGASLMLHALELRIRLPGAGDQTAFRAPIPGRFLAVASSLGLEPFPEVLY